MISCLSRFAKLLSAVLMFQFAFSAKVNAQDGFGTCAEVSMLRANERNDQTLGAWANPFRPGHSWDFSASSISGGQAGAALVWWTYDINGMPIWLMAQGNYAANGQTGWNADLIRYTKLGSNPVVSKMVGTVAIAFNPDGNANKMEMSWQLFGSSSVNGNPNRVSITGKAEDEIHTECVRRVEHLPQLSAGDAGAPAPTAAFAGAWTFDDPANSHLSFFTQFGRLTRDWNFDGRLDEDRELEFGMLSMYNSTNGTPRWAVVQREVDAVKPQLGERALITSTVSNGYCAWCPVATYNIIPAGEFKHQFTSISTASAYIHIDSTITGITPAGTPASEILNVTVGSPAPPLYGNGATMTRLTAGQFDYAEPADAPAPAGFVNPGTDLNSDTVGSTAGEFRVDESGAATYSIPIMTVPGAGGFAPQMALAYSSAAGDGLLGVGWNISGLSSISRCRRTKESGDAGGANGTYPPVSLVDGQDVFCMDGQRLIQVHSGSESVDGATLTYHEYRTEIESFSRVRGYRPTNTLGQATANDPIWFAVWGKDGSYREYGRDQNSENSRLDANANGVRRAGVVFSWAINKLRDAGKNTIRFVYGADQNNGEQWISEVRYTGNDATGLTPESANHKVVFTYNVDTAAIDVAYSARSKTQRMRWLDSVRSLSGGSEVRRYTLGYEVNLANSNYRKQITSINECNGTTCYPATSFTRSTGSSLFGTRETVSDNPSLPLSHMVDNKFGDVNGDGRTDMVWLNDNTKLYVRLTTSNGTGIAFSENPTPLNFGNEFDNDRGWHLLDFNADGKDDLLVTEYDFSSKDCGTGACWYVRLSEGDRFSASRITTGVEAEEDAEGVLVDMTGDGLPDLITGGANNSVKVSYLTRYSTDKGLPLSFASPVPVSFGTGFTVRPRKIDHDQFEALDVNGDGLADLVMKGALVGTGTGGFPHDVDPSPQPDAQPNTHSSSPTSPAVVAGSDNYWMVFVNQGLVGKAMHNFELYQKWLATGTGAIASDDDDKFRVVDINGDGLADVFYRRANTTGQWVYELNLGKRADESSAPTPSNSPFTTAVCAIGGSLATGCAQLRTDRLLKLQDFNGDGKADIWDISISPLTGTADNYPYRVHLWQNSAFASSNISTCSNQGAQACAIAYNTNASTSSTPRLAFFPDLDGDGLSEQLSVKWSSSNSGQAWHYHRNVNPYTPRNLVTEITNGLGAKTLIQYAPMGFASVYRRDFDSAYLNYWRGSAVQDLNAPNFVVEAVESCAPGIRLDANGNEIDKSNCNASYGIPDANAGFARVEYGYRGAKVQGGGRGFLGFRVLETFDNQRNVLTRSEYAQEFPYIGRAKRTRAWHLPTQMRSDVCSSPYNTQCFTTADCEGSLSACAVSPAVGVLFKSDVMAGASGRTLLSESSDLLQRALLTVAPGGDNTNQYQNPTSLPGNPVVVRVDPVNSRKVSFDLALGSDNPTESQSLRREFTEFQKLLPTDPEHKRYDDFGNPAKVSTVTYDAAGNALSSVVGVNTYVNHANTWQLGRLSQTVATTTRDGISKSRTSTFEYDPTSKLLTRESVMVGGGAEKELNTFHQYDSFGNKIKTATCSQEFNTAATCLNVSASAIASQPSGVTADTSIRRYARSVYDSQGRFANQSIELFFSSPGAAREVATSTVNARNSYGDPTSVTVASGSMTTLLYGPLGRKFHEYNNTGAASTTRYAWCGGATPCPLGAKYRVEVSTRGAPTTWTYFDVLGRDILAMKEAFAAGQYTAVRKHYDHLGKVFKVSEPYFAVGPFAASVGTLVSGSTYWTKTRFDAIDRPFEITHSNSKKTTMAYNGLVTVTTDPRLKTRTEQKNALGEVVRVTDHNNNSVCFSYDTYGNLKTTGKSNAANCSIVSNTQTMTYDDLGRKTSMVDADMGAWSYTYNAAGEMITQISPRGVCTKNSYDVRGRVWQRVDYTTAACTGAEHTSIWVFDTLKPGQITSESSTASYLGMGSSNQFKVLSYDLYGRVSTVNSTIDGVSVSERSTYDELGRPFQNFDASGNGTLTQYNARGYLYRIRDAVPGLNGEVYYEVRAMDARDKVVTEWRGVNVQTVGTTQDVSMRGVETRRYFEATTGFMTGIQSGDSHDRFGNPIQGNHIQHWTYSYDDVGNVTQRQDWRADGQFVELAVYDNLNRLDLLQRYQGSGLTLRATEDYNFDAWGNLIAKHGITGALQYGQTNTACALRNTAGPHAVTTANGITYCYDQAGNQVSATDGRSIQYSVADQVRSIGLTASNKSTRYWYGASRNRYKRMDYNNASFTGAAKTTRYFGNVEHISHTDGDVEIKRHVAGVVIISTSNYGSRDKKEYLFTDHLGSTDVITDRFGNADNLCFPWDEDNNPLTPMVSKCHSSQRMSFEAFGARRKPADNTSFGWMALSFGERTNFNVNRTTRGFTGHEMVDGVDLVHMNGRMYDPELGRFIQADPIIQDPYNTQSLNRYSYVLNNPLTATDPTGYMSVAEGLRIVVAVAITVYSGGTAAGAAWGFFGTSVTAGQALAAAVIGGALSGGIQSGTLKGAVIGAFSGAVFHGIGVSNLGPAARVAAHATAGGVMSVLQGGKFGHGFASAGLMKAITPLIDVGDVGSKAGKAFAEGAIHSVVGGTVSHLTGGKFANGAVTSAMQYAFNGLYGKLAKAGKKIVDGKNPLEVVTETIDVGSGVVSGCATSTTAQCVGNGVKAAVMELTPGGDLINGGKWLWDKGKRFFRGAPNGVSPSLVPRPNDFKVDPNSGLVRETHGVSVFDNPQSVSQKGFVPHEVDQNTISSNLQIIQRGNDKAHYEITPAPGANLSPQQFVDACSRIKCK